MGIRSLLASLGGQGDRDPLDGTIKMPCHATYVHWDFASPLDVIEFDLTIFTDPGTSVGEYLAPFSGSIDGSQFYFGMQTDIQHPVSMMGVGKGLIFSTWWSFSESDIRVADDGFFQLGTHEGRFVGVRRTFEWGVGDYRLTIARADVEVVDGRELDWFDLTITPTSPKIPGADARPEPTGEPAWIGAMRFPRRTPGVPARVDPRAPLFLEVYSGADRWREVPVWDFDVMAYGNGVRCPGGRNEYPAYPHKQLMPNTNAAYDAARDRVRVAFGGEIPQTTPAGPWS